jgi:hypothetical protein
MGWRAHMMTVVMIGETMGGEADLLVRKGLAFSATVCGGQGFRIESEGSSLRRCLLLEQFELSRRVEVL